MKVGDKVKFRESGKHEVEEAVVTKDHGNGLYNVEVKRGKGTQAFNSTHVGPEKGGAFIVREDKK